MNIDKVNISSMPTVLLNGLRPYLLLDFFDFPYLTVDINTSGSYFLNYYVSGKEDNLNRILVEISKERLKSLISEEITLKKCFDYPENNIVYYGQFNRKNEITNLSFLLAADFAPINPILSEFKFDADIDLSVLSVNNQAEIKVKSQQIQKLLIDVYLQADTLKTTLKYWSIKNFLLPFTELIRTSLLNETDEHTIRTLDNNVNLGYRTLNINSLFTTIEISSPSYLFTESKNAKNVINLFAVLAAVDEEHLIVSLNNFYSKKIVIEYVKVLNTIIKNNAVLNSKMATPNGDYYEVNLDKRKAVGIKKIIEEKIPVVEDTEEVDGSLLELSFDKKDPTFAMSPSAEDGQIRGKISHELTQKLNAEQREFVFNVKEYTFTIHTMYTPANGKSPEKIVRTLIEISEKKST